MDKKEEAFLKIQSRVESVRDQYRSSASQFSNFLVYGDFGTGKTKLASTCPTPVFIDSFDPGGTKTAALQEGIGKGDIIVDNRWEKESWRHPIAYKAWDEEMVAREKEGFFDYIGTYVLDSATKWSDALMFEIMRRGSGGASRAGKNPQLQDYLLQQLTAIDCLGHMMSLPCHTLVTGHKGIEKDETTGKIETGLLMYGKLSAKVPLVFDEKYITRVKDSSKGSEYVLQTKNDGYYKAETRIGGGKFDTFEAPDIKRLLVKAGKSAEDKKPLFQGPPDLVDPVLEVVYDADISLRDVRE